MKVFSNLLILELLVSMVNKAFCNVVCVAALYNFFQLSIGD